MLESGGGFMEQEGVTPHRGKAKHGQGNHGQGNKGQGNQGQSHGEDEQSRGKGKTGYSILDATSAVLGPQYQRSWVLFILERL